MEFELVNKESYSDALNIARKFVEKKGFRPVLQYALHKANGDLVVTDSHRLIVIKDIHGFKTDYLINPKTFTVAKGVYPDVEKIFNDNEFKKAITINNHQIFIWLQMFKSFVQTLKAFKDTFKKASFIFSDNNKLTVEFSSSNIKIDLPCDVEKPAFEKISFNAEYMLDALESHYKLGANLINIHLGKSVMRPILLDDEKTVKNLILPIRS